MRPLPRATQRVGAVGTWINRGGKTQRPDRGMSGRSGRRPGVGSSTVDVASLGARVDAPAFTFVAQERR